MNGKNDVGPNQRQQFVIAFHVFVVIDKPCPTEISLRQFVALDHSAHGAIQDQDPPPQLLHECGATGIAFDWIGQFRIRHGTH